MLVVLAGMALIAGAIWSVFVLSEGYVRATDGFGAAEKACEELVPPGLADSPERHACLERELARPPISAGDLAGPAIMIGVAFVSVIIRVLVRRPRRVAERA